MGTGSIPTFRPSDNPTRANFNARIETANDAIAGKQDRLTGTAGQVVGFDAAGNAVAQAAPDMDCIPTEEIDEIIPGPVEFSCTMQISGSTRLGGSWSASCTLNFRTAGDSYSAEGSIRVDDLSAMVDSCTVSGVPADKVTQNSLLLSDTLFLDRDATGVYGSSDMPELIGFFGTPSHITSFTAVFADHAAPQSASSSSEQAVDQT